MPASEVLKGFRKGGYGMDKPEGQKESSGGPRMIKLTDDEMKDLQSYQKGPGMEQECLVTGRLGENGDFTVSSVRNPGGDGAMPEQNEMAAKMMGPTGGPPMMS